MKNIPKIALLALLSTYCQPCYAMSSWRTIKAGDNNLLALSSAYAAWNTAKKIAHVKPDLDPAIVGIDVHCKDGVFRLPYKKKMTLQQ